MSREAILLNEIWSIVSPQIPSKERKETALQLVELFDEYSMTDGFEHETEFEGVLKAAIVEYFDLGSKDKGGDEGYEYEDEDEGYYDE